MSDRFYFRTGQKNLQKMPVASATVISKNDMLWYDTTNDVVKPASDFAWTTDLATTQGNFAAVFVGVAEESSASGDTDDISVDTSSASVYAMPCASATFNLNDTVGPAKQSGNALENQKVVAAVAAASIGRVDRKTDGAETSVRVSFAPAFSTASSNVNANIG